MRLGRHAHIYFSGALVTREHTKPTLAFIVLAVLAAAVIGSSHRADDDGDAFIAEASISKRSPTTQNAVPAEQTQVDERDDANERATRPSRGGTERVELPPAPILIHDSGDLSATHTVDAVDTEQWLPLAHGAGHPKKRSHARDGVEHEHEHGQHRRRATAD